MTLNYPASDKTYKSVLVKELEPLGKALARRGSYKQIAVAAFSCQPLKNCLINKTLDTLQKECDDLCSKKKPSLLRKSEADMKNFSLFQLCHEWKERAPLFYSFLMTCSSGYHYNKDDKRLDWSPAIAVAGSALLKKRNVHMNATASLISVMVRQSGIQVHTLSMIIIKHVFYSWFDSQKLWQKIVSI